MDEKLKQRLNALARIAVVIERDTGLPAQVLIAQWAIESRWGAKPVGASNYFGTKKAARHQICCSVLTREVVNGRSIMQRLEFADYASIEDSCRDYAWLITHGAPYAAAWKQYQQDRDVGKLIERIAKVYATDPQYARLVTAISGQSNVTAAIENARAVSS